MTGATKDPKDVAIRSASVLTFEVKNADAVLEYLTSLQLHHPGKWQGWMDGATDFFGNPRATPDKKVSIGYYQAPGPCLMLLVK